MGKIMWSTSINAFGPFIYANKRLCNTFHVSGTALDAEDETVNQTT
jgi:hypothetical protein